MTAPVPPANPKGLVDDFTYWLLVICAGITLLDWLLGEKRRERLRDKVVDWWVYVENSTVGSFMSFQAQALLTSRRESTESVFFWSFITGLIAFGAGILFCRHIFHTNVPLKSYEVGFSPHVFIAPILLGLVMAVAGITLQESLLKRLSRTTTGVSVLFACSATLIYVSAVFVMILMSAILANVYDFQ
jgi:cation transport ATPase